MKEDSVRTTVDIPAPLYRKLKAQAAAGGHSIRELVLAGVKSILLRSQRPPSKRVQFPLIVSKGPKVNVTNEQIYCGSSLARTDITKVRRDSSLRSE